MSGRLLVATDGRDDAHGAFGVAASLAERDGLDVDVLTVVEPLAADAGFMVEFPHRTEIERARAEELLARVTRRIEENVPLAVDWQVGLEVGHPAATIARVARDLDASLIELDVDHHDAAGNKFALEVIQL
ncbi:MAG: universal stress protein, partial [Gemmatimonadota bacterium]